MTLGARFTKWGLGLNSIFGAEQSIVTRRSCSYQGGASSLLEDRAPRKGGAT
jgi:hypothetical protein